MSGKKSLIHDSLFRNTTVPLPATGAKTEPSGTVPLQLIDPNPNQPRKVFNREKLEELKHSLNEKGLIEPIVLRTKDSDRYEIICGERRWRAAKELGWLDIPAVIREVSDENEAFELALLENIQRSDLTPVEEAEAYNRMIESDIVKNQSELADRIGISRQAISFKMALLKLPKSIKDILSTQVDKNAITETHLRNFNKLGNEELMMRIANQIVNEGLSVKTTNEIIEQLGSGALSKTQPAGALRTVQHPFKPFKVLSGNKNHGIFIKDDSSKFIVEAKGAPFGKLDEPEVKDALDKLFSAIFN